MRFRCPECRTRRTSFVLLLKHCADRSHGVCRCGGYHHPHRAGSRFCDANVMSPVWRLMREDAHDELIEDVMLEIVLTTPGKPMNEWRQ